MPELMQLNPPINEAKCCAKSAVDTRPHLGQTGGTYLGCCCGNYREKKLILLDAFRVEVLVSMGVLTHTFWASCDPKKPAHLGQTFSANQDDRRKAAVITGPEKLQYKPDDCTSHRSKEKR